ncbi:hypothetical protein BH10ACI1_BH10ACI1_16890 [soil metagenome]
MPVKYLMFGVSRAVVPLYKNIESPAPLLEIRVGFQKYQTLFTFAGQEIPQILKDKKLDAADVERDENIYNDWLQAAGFERIQCNTYIDPTKMLYGFKN